MDFNRNIISKLINTCRFDSIKLKTIVFELTYVVFTIQTLCSLLTVKHGITAVLECIELSMTYTSLQRSWNICVTNYHGLCPTYGKHVQLLSSFMAYHQVCYTTGATSGAGTVYPSGAPQFISWVRVTRSLVLYVCFVDRCLFFCPFSFDNRVVCPFYGF